MIVEIDETRLSELAELLRAGFADVAEQFGLTIENAPTNAAFITVERLSRQLSRGVKMYAWQQDARLIGTASLAVLDNGEYEMDRLCVLPEFRHKGIGRDLIGFIAERARERGAHSLTIGIIEENARLREWYADIGFLHIGTKVYEHLPFVVGYMKMLL